MHEVYLILGGNIGERFQNLVAARLQIYEQIGQIVEASSIYETQAWGVSQQPAFLNQALKVITDLEAHEILKKIHSIEQSLGRVRFNKWSERTIDIDILFYDDQAICSEELVVPHLHLHERRFVLMPLLEIAPSLFHPILRKNIKQLYAACTDKLDVMPLSSS